MAVTADKVVVELELKDGQYLAKVKQAESQFTRSQNNMANASKNAERQIKASSGAIGAALTRMAGSIAAAASVGAIVKMGDAYTNLQSRLKALGLEGAALADVEDRLYEIANRNGVAVDAVTQLYQRASMARKNLGASEEDLEKIVSGTSAALRLQGTSATQASGALLQFGQLLGGSVVQAQEYNSLIDQMPVLLQAVADGSDRWAGSVPKLTEDVKAGKVATKEFADAAIKGFAQIEERAGSLPKTVGQAMQILNDNLGRYVGQADQGLSATARLAQGIEALANNLDRVIPALTVIAGAFALRWAAGMIAAAVASDGFAGKAWAAAQKAIAAEKAKTAAVAAETRTRTMLINAEVMALQRQVATGRNAQGQFINMAAAQTQLNASTRALAGSLPAATAATARNTTAMQAAALGARGMGAGLVSLAGGPIGAVVLAVGGLVYALAKLNAQWDKASPAQERLTGAMQDAKDAADKYEEALIKASNAQGQAKKTALEEVNALKILTQQKIKDARASLVAAQAELEYARSRAASYRESQRLTNAAGGRGDIGASGALGGAGYIEGQFERAEARSEAAYERGKATIDKLTKDFEGLEAKVNAPIVIDVTGTSEGAARVGRVSEAIDTTNEDAKELARALADIQYSLLTDAEKAAKELAEQTEILNKAVEERLITRDESSRMQGGLAAQGLQGYEAADIKPIGQEIMRPFQDFADELAREQEQVAGNMARTFTDILASGNIGEAIGNEFKRAAFNGLEIIMKELLLAALPAESGRGFLSQIFGFGGNRANGGMVRAGSSYTVGENGRETFVPSQNGYIIPNMKNMKVGGGQPSVVKIIVDEGAMFSARVQQISGPIAVQASVGAASYSQESMRTQRRRQSQSFV